MMGGRDARGPRPPGHQTGIFVILVHFVENHAVGYEGGWLKNCVESGESVECWILKTTES